MFAGSVLVLFWGLVLMLGGLAGFAFLLGMKGVGS
jgi:hypothetical protein